VGQPLKRDPLPAVELRLVDTFGAAHGIYFTITYSIVAAIVETRVEIVGLLLPTALIAVMAALMAQSHLAEIAKNADNPQIETMARAAASAVSSISQVAVQFTSNLVAMGLSEVIANSRDTAWVLWFVLVAIGMLYAAAEVLNGPSGS